MSGVNRMIAADLTYSGANGAALSKLQNEKKSAKAITAYPAKGSKTVTEKGKKA